MDAAAFDALSRALSAPETRRRLLGLAATLPLLGWLDPEQSAARDRRRRRKGRHKHKQGKATGKRLRQQRKRACKPQGRAKTCAGTCGPVKSRKTCGKTVDCGSCACAAPCGVCLICQSGANTPGACVPDPAQVGEACGSAGQVCAADGTCACAVGTCANPSPICDSGTCAVCAASSECIAEDAGDRCCAGSCYEGVCCGDDECLSDGAPDCVDYDCVCAGNGNAACSGDDACCGDGCANLHTDPDHCGACATACASPTPTCEAGKCVGCSAARPCGAGLCCRGDGTCVTACPACQVCAGGQCVADASLQRTCAGPCPSGEWCEAGACASIQATVRLPDCQSVCGGSMEVCGQTVTCPSCIRCTSQTGCSFNTLPDGPVGAATYCSLASSHFDCATNADCASAGPFAYCNSTGSCTRICPF